MSEKLRILVHTMHEAQALDAESILDEASRRGATLVEGLADEGQIQALRDRKYAVELVEDIGAEASGGESGFFRAAATLDWQVRGDRIEVRRDGKRLPAPAPSRGGTFSLKMTDPVAPFSEVLAPAGVRLDRMLSGGFGVAYLEPTQRRRLEADERIDVVPFNLSPARMPLRKLTANEQEAIAPATGEVRLFDLIAHSEARVSEIEAWARARSLDVVGTSPTKVRIRLADTSPLLDEADDLDAVLNVRPVPRVRLCLDHARAIVGLPASAGDPAVELDGAEEMIGMIDGGVDAAHPDLAGRVILGGGTAGPPSAHGTHVAGIMIGDGSCSAGRFVGIAPAAQVVAHALPTGPDGEIELEADFAAMLESAYQAGARIENLSFEEEGPLSLYSQLAEELDAFAAARPDMLIVAAAGNSGLTESPAWRRPGEVDLQSISAPGVAKNALTVGASCSDRIGGHVATDWNGYAPERFVSPPTSQEALSGDAAGLAAFSGRGWGQDYRIKPDLVAPGTNIVAARASGSADLLWGEESPHYLYSGGTSMAAPVVAGCAALIRQHYRRLGHPAPSAALLKATLANGARWLTSASASQTDPPVPVQPCANLDQGFGRVDVKRSLGLARAGDRLCFIDVTSAGMQFHTLAKGGTKPLVPGDELRRFWLRCEIEGPLDVALCYTDPVPGSSGAVLSLMVQPVGGEPRMGNDRAIKPVYARVGTPADRVNTLQVVRLDQVSGKVEIKVLGLALRGRTVGFALVVRGPIENGRLYAF